MQVHRDIHALPLFKNAVVTIGTFDGVHTGHLQILRQMKQQAEMIKGETVIVTFDPHPRSVIERNRSDKPEISSIKLLNTLDEKIMLLERQQIDHLVLVNFTKKFSEQPAEDYIKEFLVAKFHPKIIIIGYDHRFGKNREGDYLLLEKFQEQFNYNVTEIPEHILNDVAISSTRIRRALKSGDVADANSALGYPYFFEGVVEEGNKLGRQIGYPTANLSITGDIKIVPCDGIYAVEAAIGSDSIVKQTVSGNLKGMMSIGVRPTIGVSKRTIEVNLFDFDQDIYGKTLRVFLISYLRPEEKFPDLDSLTRQIDQDKINALKMLERS